MADFNLEKIRKDFPILNRQVNGKKLVYLDNAATSQKPNVVIESLNDFYTNYNSNVHRGVHKLSVEATDSYENARVKIANFINASSNEIIWTRGTSESLNIVSIGLKDKVEAGDNIVVSRMEHHSNLVPWQQLCNSKNAELRFLDHDI
ncbi:MAG: aminotransferase class V-fold PLP-dependent enzyme, partial [Chloroflexota bacterium]|nr:aminotransferase class V-fold PLP-dependent enzyme [Chloroflexota bacterium]